MNKLMINYSLINLNGKQVFVPSQFLNEVIEKNDDVIVISTHMSTLDIINFYKKQEIPTN